MTTTNISNITSNTKGFALKSHQRSAVTSMVRIWEHGANEGTGTALGALLADDMGLGKCASTVVAARLARMRRVLVVCPKSAISDWVKELQEWHPFPGVIRTPKSTDFAFRVGWLIINYEKLKYLAHVLRDETFGQWDLIVLDEAHYTKEIKRRRSILVYGGIWKGKHYPPLPSHKRLVISGTPIKNRLEEIQQQIAWLDGEAWGDRDAMIDRYYEPLDEAGMPRIVTPDSKVLQHWRPQDLEELHARLKASILVRTPKSQIEGLPARRYELVEVPVPGDEDEDNINCFDSKAWFDSKGRQLMIIEHDLKKAYRERDLHRISKLEQDKKEILSVVYQHTTRIKRKPVLDYPLGLPRDHKVVVIGTHRSLLLDQLAVELRKAKRRVVEHNGTTTKQVAWTVKQFQENPKVQFFIGQLSTSSLSLTLITPCGVC
jgi:SNF2 family DNA or RNA helicase